MDRINRCLSQIEAIRRVADGDEPAYVARSRIGRLATSIASFTAERLGVVYQGLPCRIEAPSDASKDNADLAQCCNRLREISRHVAQPSEPLGSRWRRDWRNLQDELSNLEKCLERIR